MLPSGYKYLLGLTGRGSFIDTGILTKSTLTIEALFDIDKVSASSSNYGYIFGARNTNSNTSAGQLNFFASKYNVADYLGWQSARVSVNLGAVAGGRLCHLSNEENTFTAMFNQEHVSTFVGSTSAFTGTRTIYLFGLNNAGTFTASQMPTTIYGFRIYDDGVLVREFIPAYEEATSTVGMFDTVEQTFYASGNSTPFSANSTISITNGVGGRGYIQTIDGELVDEAMFDFQISPLQKPLIVNFVAVAEDGYVFKYWTRNGVEISTDPMFQYDNAQGSATFEAHFEKKTDVQLEIGMKAVILPYDNYQKRNKTYISVLSADIKEDFLERVSSELICQDVPENLHLNSVLFLYNARGKLIYCGVVRSIEENKLICETPISLYDDDTRMLASWYDAHHNPLMTAQIMMSIAGLNIENTYLKTKRSHVENKRTTFSLTLDRGKILNIPSPAYETGVVNVQDAMIDYYARFGVGLKYYPIETGGQEKVAIEPFYPMILPALDIGDNMEIVHDVSVTTEEADCTVLEVYSSNGATLRGIYAMGGDGKVITGDTLSIEVLNSIGYNMPKQKVVLSDDPLNTIVKENLNSAFYNHKISLILDLIGQIRFEDLQLGMPVNLFLGNRLYNTAITGWEYFITSDEVNSINLTLGNVRTNLTSKLNMGR